jgi:hypothetical protein
MIEFIKKIFAKWFKKKEVVTLTEEIVEPVEEVEEVELPTHCTGHTRFKKSCPLCNEIIA